MKIILTLVFTLFVYNISLADLGTLETLDINAGLVGISFADNDKSLVLTFSDEIETETHSIIDINRINDLEYKTRVMRYFGGMLVNDTFHFKNLVVVVEGKKLVYNWSRDNVSTIVKKMCCQAELMM